MLALMTQQKESLNILRHAGELGDEAINLGEAALALAIVEKPDAQMGSYREHLAVLVEQLREGGTATCTEEQLRLLRRVLVVQQKYQGDDNHLEDPRSTNIMDVIDRRRGSPLTLGVLYLHVAAEMGWAMTGIDLAGHFLLRLSARDGSVIIDPFRAGQTCQIEEVDSSLLDEEEEDELVEILEESSPISFSADLLRPLSRRDVLLRLQHQVKRRQLGQDRSDAAIKTLQGMILFAPRKQDLWRELGYLQAERGHIRAAITALEVVRDLASDPLPLRQTDGMIRELRWRLN